MAIINNGEIRYMELTRAEALASAPEGSTHYLITDQVFGRLGAVNILMHASLNEAGVYDYSQEVSIYTTFDNTAWVGQYDINANQVLFVQDNLGNRVYGSNNVLNFDWGNAGFINNIIEQAHTLITTDNTTTLFLQNNRFSKQRTSNLTGFTGVISNNEINGTINAINASGSISYNMIDGTLSISNANKTVSNTSILGGYTVSLTTTGSVSIQNSTMQRSITVSAGNMTILGGLYTGQSSVQQTGATTTNLYGCTVDGYGFITITKAVGTNNIYGLRLSGQGQYRLQTLATGTHNSYYNTIDSGEVSINSTGGETMQYNSITSNSRVLTTGDTTGLFMYYNSINGGCLCQILNSPNTTIQNVSQNSYGFLLFQNNTGTQRLYYTNIDSHGQWLVQNNAGAINDYYNNISSLGYMYRTTLTGQTGSVQRCSSDSTGVQRHGAGDQYGVKTGSSCDFRSNGFSNTNCILYRAGVKTATANNNGAQWMPLANVI